MVCAARQPDQPFDGAILRRGAAGVSLALGLMTSIPVSAQLIPTERPAEIRGMDLQNKLGDKLPLTLEFTDSSAKRVKLDDLFHHNRPVVIAMVYFRCPLLCPQLQQKVIASFNRLDFTIGTDYDVVFVSFDPRDGAIEAEKAKNNALLLYSRTANEPVKKGLSYLVGTAENTRAVADALGFPYKFLPESGEFSHGTAVYVATPEGVVSRCFPKLDYEASDFRLALVDASGGKIGTLVDRFTLWCYHPTDSGKYVVSPMGVMRVGAGLSAVALMGFVGMWAGRDYLKRRRGTGQGAGTSVNEVAYSSALGQPR